MLPLGVLKLVSVTLDVVVVVATEGVVTPSLAACFGVPAATVGSGAVDGVVVKDALFFPPPELQPPRAREATASAVMTILIWSPV